MAISGYTRLEVESIPTFTHTLQFTVTYGFAERLSKEPPSALFTVAGVIQVIAALNVIKLWMTDPNPTEIISLLQIAIEFMLRLSVMFCSNLVAQLISLSINEVDAVWAAVLIAYASLLLLAGAIGSDLTDLKTRHEIHVHNQKMVSAIMK